MKAYQLSKNEVGVSKHLPLTHLNSPTIFELVNGQVGCIIQVKGVPFDTATNELLNSYKRSLHLAICALGDEFAIYQNTFRQQMNIKLTGTFPAGFLEDINTQYQAQFQGKRCYANELYLTVLYKGMASGKFGKSMNWFQRTLSERVKQARQAYRQQAIVKLTKAVSRLMATLGRFQPILLGERDDQLGYSEILNFYGRFVNGLSHIPFPYASFASPLLSGVSGAEKALARYPAGNLANYLPAKRLFFGDYMEFLGVRGESKFGAVLSIKSYSSKTFSIMLDKLLHLDCEFISTNSFAIEPNEVAKQKIVKQLVRMENSGDLSDTQLEEFAQCRDDLISERLMAGYHHYSLLLLATDLKHLQAMVNQAIRFFSDAGLVAIQENLGLEPAFWAQLPGNQKYMVRTSFITSQNFVDFSPLHNYRTGYRDKNHLGGAVTLIETPSKTPMFFNFHSAGSGDKNDLTPGHTTVIGGNGSGKTVFVGFMDAQMSRYGGRSFFFDRDRGMEIYVRATGGVYARISPDHRDVKFNPFCLADTPTNRSFLKSWLSQLVKEPGEVELPAEIDAQISECVDYAYDALSTAHRYLSSVTQILPIDFPRWARLRKWLRGDGVRNDGEYAYLFDHEVDDLNLDATKMGFDLTELFSQPGSVLTAVCMYLMHRITISLDGQRVSIYFDEGWQVLDNEYWQKQLKQALATLRKSNAKIVLLTQSPATVVGSVLSAQFFDNCATNIFFCNEKANYEQHYKHFNITESEFDFIKNTPREQRLFLYKQGEDSAICQLNLGDMKDALAVFSGNKATVQLLDDIRAEVGDDPSVWLPKFHARRHFLSERL